MSAVDPGLQAVKGHRMTLASRLAIALTALALAMLAAGCASSSEDLFPDKRTIGVPVGGVGHYGSGILVTEFIIDEKFRAGYVGGWGGGGAGNCCVLLPLHITEPILVTVRWKTSQDGQYRLFEHEATVPIHFAVEPGGSSGMYVHFLPGHLVQVWVSRAYPESALYPGPSFPRGPAPPYIPLPGEKSMPSQAKPR
ncbi:DUF3304 domain-containing protein [Pseudacidovorax sp. RU35E]|uniref:DUF3304 domain-containing protein n=1 Tax=Pseudacidovorax sp. RU35E TaxID=1907403 RepID=UPI0009571430|nr:DUF3304 domain-containing protein [Pseudacidovorax sp. RU35E]SIR68228.1 Protein of unknown function [Pseudacidovorax sp. RU35E]